MPSEGRSSFEYLEASTAAAVSAEAATECQEAMGAANEERDVGGGPSCYLIVNLRKAPTHLLCQLLPQIESNYVGNTVLPHLTLSFYLHLPPLCRCHVWPFLKL